MAFVYKSIYFIIPSKLQLNKDLNVKLLVKHVCAFDIFRMYYVEQIVCINLSKTAE